MNPLPDKFFFEKQARSLGYRFIAGVDEAGRGPLAGPVVAAACILPEGFDIEGIDDSKKLLPAERMRLYEILAHHPDVLYGIGIIDQIIIDQINILRATYQAMLQAVRNLTQKPDYILLDGNQVPNFKIHTNALVGGDAISISIGAASIIAKVTRDRIMIDYHEKWPQYGFAAHKGYATELHLKALKEHGPCPIHRRSFNSGGAIECISSQLPS